MMVVVGFGIFLPFERAAKGLNFVVLESSCLIKAGHEGGNSNEKRANQERLKVRWKTPEAPDRGSLEFCLQFPSFCVVSGTATIAMEMDEGYKWIKTNVPS
jgi:hypothetical protein